MTVERARAIRSSVEEPVVRPAEPHALPRLLKLPEVAEVLRVSPKTVQRLLKRGLPCIRFGRSVRFEPKAVSRWLDARKEE
jgi:excisionase family DNA binding protein